MKQAPLITLVLSMMLHDLTLAQDARQLAEKPTTLAAVMQSTLDHFPQILAAREDIAVSRALAFASLGAFDPRIDASIDNRLSGQYNGQGADLALLQPLPVRNMQLFAGYRVSDGSYPLYENSALTRELGELRMGVAMSLLRDRDIDSQRAAIGTTELDVLVRQQQLTAEQIKVLQQAFVAYAQWLLATRLHEAYEGLLEIAISRGEALERSVQAGNTAEILLVENRQAVLQRQGLVTDAKRQIDMAAEQLSIYLRDETGSMQYPPYVPELEMPEEDPDDFAQPVEQLLDSVLELRPEIHIARLAQSQARIQKRLAENLALPKVDLRMYTARDFGNGPALLGGTDNVVDLSFSLPLRTREARGKASAAQAEIDGLEHRIRMLENQIEADIRRTLVNLEATRQMEAYAIQELEMSQQLAVAEQQRFEAGLSDFFLLNVRERQVGEAQLKRWQANLAHQIALANFYAASMNTSGLGQP